MDLQEHLLYITKLRLQESCIPKIRGVSAFWKQEENTACISFYFNGEITEDGFDLASDLCGEIISHFPDGLLEEHYIRWDTPKPLPKENFIPYNPQNES